jgi:uncharacterized short protein YbdD (DUF466 family)
MGKRLMLNKLKLFWRNILELSGEDAYERYLMRLAEHQKLHGVDNGCLEHHKPLSRQAFFKQWQDGKWTGIKRCC